MQILFFPRGLIEDFGRPRGPREGRATCRAKSASPDRNRGRLALAGLAALGVVFGDIGTSPLYTLKTVLDYTGPHPDPAATLGALSLILWTLFLITTVKYVNFAMRIDNDGEGGIIALMTLLGVKKHQRPIIVAAGLFGAALIYGDGAITPAISVLSALEGVEQVAPTLADLRAAGGGRDPAGAVRRAAARARRRSAAPSGRSCSPGSSSWRCSAFTALSGIRGVFVAINPCYGLDYLAGGVTGFLVLGGVFLCVTGAEALYADMGHFGTAADPPRLELRGVPEPHPQLRRPGGDRARRRADRRQHLLPPLPRAAADAADRAGDGRDRHRQPVDHHRRLFDDAAGDPARLAAAPDASSRPRRRAMARSMSAPSTGC